MKSPTSPSSSSPAVTLNLPSVVVPAKTLQRWLRERKNHEPVIAILGSSVCPISDPIRDQIRNALVGFSYVLVRRNMRGTTVSHVEEAVLEEAPMLGCIVIEVSPDGTNGAATRDAVIAENADALVAFFPFEDIMGGGTGRIVQAAIRRGVEVEVYGVWNDGTIFLAGAAPEGEPDPF